MTTVNQVDGIYVVWPEGDSRSIIAIFGGLCVGVRHEGLWDSEITGRGCYTDAVTAARAISEDATEVEEDIADAVILAAFGEPRIASVVRLP